MTVNASTSDEALMAAVAADRSEAMDELYRRYAGELAHYFRHFESYDAGADDLVQDTFVRVLRYRAAFDPARPFRNWLFGIARNVALGVRRGPGRESLDDTVLTAPQHPGREYRTAEALAALKRALDALPVHDREVIVLARIEGRSYREVGVMLGITEGAVKVRVFRALQRLRSWLHHNGNPGGWIHEQ
ncbi:MAG TPA: sigma-70 family RNA polymerase sigma factor [Longimicrobiales bacterium]